MLNDAKKICLSAIEACVPAENVRKQLREADLGDSLYLVAVGKAAYAMAAAALDVIKVKKGIIITKYGHLEGQLPGIEAYEASHPLLDENSLSATEKVLAMCNNLKEDDEVIFLLSGGASSLFEKPKISLAKLRSLNDQMLKKGLSIDEINTIRKKLSYVKGGGFADICAPAKVYGIILSDVLDDRPDIIGSGPSVEDLSGSEEALRIIAEYHLDLDEECLQLIRDAGVHRAANAENHIIGSVKILCEKAKEAAEKLGYRTHLLSDHVEGEAAKAGDLLYAEILKYRNEAGTALIMGGETIVKVKGNGKGGRNQHLVFSQIGHLKDMKDVLIMSLGSDGTDGPTDAAGGYIDGSSFAKLQAKGLDYKEILENCDSYNGLKAIDSLIITGPTGTNVNDITIALIAEKN